MKHTPGPWTVVKASSLEELLNKHFVINAAIFAEDRVLGVIAPGDPGGITDETIVEDNAHLMAMAPEMLEVLENANKLIEKMMPGVQHIALDIGFLNNTLMALTAVLKKAKGE